MYVDGKEDAHPKRWQVQKVQETPEEEVQQCTKGWEGTDSLNWLINWLTMIIRQCSSFWMFISSDWIIWCLVLRINHNRVHMFFFYISL